MQFSGSKLMQGDNNQIEEKMIGMLQQMNSVSTPIME